MFPILPLARSETTHAWPGGQVGAFPRRLNARWSRHCRTPSGRLQMTSQGTVHGRFQRAIQGRHLLAAETAARELGGLDLAEALDLTLLMRETDVGAKNVPLFGGSGEAGGTPPSPPTAASTKTTLTL